MKIVFICRLFSAFQSSLETGEWAPTGMPAFYKLLEALNENKGAEIVFISFPDSNFKPGVYKFENLPRLKFRILSFRKVFGIDSFDRILNFIFNFTFILRKHCFRRRLFYCDQANVKTGAILCFLQQNVVLRMFGVASQCERLQKKGKFGLPSLAFWSYKANFKKVIITRDGSPGGKFAENFLRPKVPWLHILNGVDDQVLDTAGEKNNFEKSSFNIITIGRIEVVKGMKDFILALVNLVKSHNSLLTHLKVTVIGDGELLKELKTIVKNEKLQSLINFSGSIPHNEIYKYLKSSDLFVSMNRRGNLSNVVLEAMNAGICIAALDNNAQTGRDSQFLINEFRKAFFFIDPDDAQASLQKLILHSLSDKKVFLDKKRNLLELSNCYLSSWEDRINDEIEILESLD